MRPDNEKRIKANREGADSEMRTRSQKWPILLLSGILAIASTLAGSPVARAQVVVATVPAGTSPFAVAVNPATNRIYVANINSNNVTVIDGATDTVAATILVGAAPCRSPSTRR